MRAKTRLILWWPALPPAPVVALPPAFSGQEALAIRKMAYVEALPQAWFATNQVDLYAGQRRRGLSSNAAVHRAQRDRHLDSWLNPCRSHRARTGCRRLHLRTQCRPDVSGFAAQFPHLHGIILVRKQKLAQGGDFAASQLTGSQAEAIERSGACTPARIADGGRCISRRDHPTWQQGDVLQRARCSQSKLHRQQSEKYLEVLWMR